MQESISENQQMKVKIFRLFTDENGKSKFETIDIPVNLADFAPPAPKVYLSIPTDANRNFFLVLPPKWHGDYHPVPSRQLMTLISGSLEVTTSDGIKRTFLPGNTALVEDTWGDGHITSNNSNDQAILSVIQLSSTSK